MDSSLVRLVLVAAATAFSMVGPAMVSAAAPAVDWKDYGRREMAAAPATIRDGPETEKARYLGAKVVEKLVSLGVPPNTSAAGRVKALALYGNPDVGTCGYLTDAMLATLEGGGFASDKLFRIVAEKSAGRVATDAALREDLVNSDHGGLGVAIGGRIWVLDAWRYASEAGSFAGFETSNYRLLGLPNWGAQLRSDGYATFKALDGAASPRAFSDPAALDHSLMQAVNEASYPTRAATPGRAPGGALSGPSVGAAPAGEPTMASTGVKLWPKLEGSSWSGEVTLQETCEEGTSAPTVYRFSFEVDGANKLKGSFDFTVWLNDDGTPYRTPVACTGTYDRSTGRFHLDVAFSQEKPTTGTVVPITTRVTLRGTLDGGVDPSDDTQAQGGLAAKHIILAQPAEAAAGVEPVANIVKVTGTWRIKHDR